MAKRVFDLLKLLPQRYRDRTIDAFLENTVAQQLARDDTKLLYGYVGSEADRTANDLYITETELERKLNQLQAVYDVTLGTERSTLSWSDFQQKLVTLGVDLTKLDDWLTIDAHNFAPPISFDPLVNYGEYLWVGPWVQQAPSTNFKDLGLAPAASIIAAAANSNESLEPEYYLIQRGPLDSGGAMLAPYPSASWSDWSILNLWVHKDDAATFAIANPSFDVGDLAAAKMPIIELSVRLQLNLYVDGNGDPAEAGTLKGQAKVSKNQPPQFNLYHSNGAHAKLTSMLFYFEENQQSVVDAVIGRRVKRDEANDLFFSHGFVDPETGRLLFAKRYNTGSSQFQHVSIWSRETNPIAPIFSNYDNVGTVINIDKFINYRNYYWIGPTISTGSLPAWNSTGLAEYSVIEQGGTSSWSVHNYWRHASELVYSDLPLYHRATKPIIEFNLKLEAELTTTQTALHQHPTFKRYLYNATTKVYDLVPAVANTKANDHFTGGRLLTRFNELPAILQLIIDATPQVAQRLTFTALNGERFACSLASGQFLTTFGYAPRELTRPATTIGDGEFTSLTATLSAVPQGLTLVFSSPTAFTVYRSTDNASASGTVGTPFTLGNVSFTLAAGTTPFVAGDVLYVENRSIIFDELNYHVKLDSTYRTFETASAIIADTTTSLKVAAAPTGVGAWETPLPFKQNLSNETRVTLREGDLIDHLASVLIAQPGFIGTAIGVNNSRTLAVNPALGGNIKYYEDRLPILLGLLAQRDFSARDLFELSSKAYEQFLNRVREYVELRLVSKLETLPVMGGSVTTLDPSILADCLEYLEQAQTSPLEADRPFYLTTMPIKALGLTTPYLGLTAAVEPVEMLDLKLNIMSLRHHDGHMTPLANVDFETLKRIVQRKILRSNGQTTSGFVGGPVPLSKPFAKHLWLNLSNSTLNVYDVLTDTAADALPTTAEIGQYAYDRNLGEVWEYNGAWVSLGTSPTVQLLPWRQLDLTATLRALYLSIEEILYAHVPPVVTSASLTTAQADPLYTDSMRREFESWALENGAEPYAVLYDASNPFTWNYKDTVLGVTPATWQNVYIQAYGTPRPDLEPWVAVNSTFSAWLAAAILGGYVPPGTTEWDVSLWPGIATWQSTTLAGLSKPAALSVNVATGELLPPYASGHPQQLFSIRPPAPRAPYLFGENGPVELLWMNSLGYKTAQQLSFFRVDPLAVVTEFWGETFVQAGNLQLVDKLGAKPAIDELQLHGEIEIDRTLVGSATVNTPPSTIKVYQFIYVSSNVYKVLANGAVVGFHTGVATAYTDATITFAATIPVRGLNIGDIFTVTVSPAGTAVVVGTPTRCKQLYLYGQLFSQMIRMTGSDETLDNSAQLLRGWRMSLGYDTGKIIDSSLAIKLNDLELADGTFELVLKERQLASLGWYSALLVTLVRVGTTERQNGVAVPGLGLTGQKGDDWVFRVDTYMPGKATVDYYLPSSDRTTFFALTGRRSTDQWTRAKPDTSSVASAPRSRTITGLQATVDYIFGIADYASALGYSVDAETSLQIDPKTNRPRDWQLLVEELIDQQFGGVSAESTYLLDPLNVKLFFKPAAGLLSEVVPLRTQTNVYSNVYDIAGNPIKGSRVFRTTALSTIVPTVNAYSARLATSKFEHTVVLDDTSGDVTIFDPFLSQAAARIFLTGRYSFNNWRPEAGGRFLANGSFMHSIEGSLQDIKELYDSSVEILDDTAKKQARALLGYASKDYYIQRGAPELTQFRFWQGALKAKGTNRALEAFVNAKQYQTASVDEYWAYKVGDYGDARKTTDVEIKLQPQDSYAERTNLLFLESDEVQLLNDDENIIETNFYDVDGYDVHPYDTDILTIPSYSSIYTVSQQEIMEPNNVHAAVLIRPTDETRWFRYDELGSLQYLEADLLYEATLIPNRVDRCYRIIDSRTGEEVNADVFELVDTALLTVYYETGELIGNTSPPSYSTPKFRRLNHAVIKIDDPLLIGRNLLVRGYGPAIRKFSPNKLLTYTVTNDQTVSNDLIWWDPARGSHSPVAHSLVSLQAKLDPAVYNQALVREKTTDRFRPWGKNEVGKVWWDTHLSEWLPYSDTKIRPDFEERKAVWGSLKDFGEIALYEWIESDVPPLKYDALDNSIRAGATVGFINKVFRHRTWEARPVLWMHTDDPQQAPWAPLKFGAANLACVDNLLYAPTGDLPVFAIGEKLSTAYFTGYDKVLDSLRTLKGCVVIRGERTLQVGSTTSPDTPNFPASVVTGNHIVKLQANAFALASSSSSVTLAYENDGGPKLRMTLGGTKTQVITLADTPVAANTLIELSFDQLGITIVCQAKIARAGTWPSSSGTAALRVAQVFIELALANIVVRPTYETETLISLPSTSLPASTDLLEEFSWVSWIDPTSFELSNDNSAPFNKWKPIVGDYEALSSISPAIAQEIRDRFESPWAVQPYKTVWTAWEIAKPTLLRITYCTYAQTHVESLQNLQFQALEQQALRARAYINGIYVPHGLTLTQLSTGLYDVPAFDTTPYDTATSLPTWFFDIDPDLLSQGDEVVVIVPPYEPSPEQLALDLSSPNADPIIMTEWKLDAPHVQVDHRSVIGTPGKVLYYFWVRQKETAPRGKSMSIALAENLLKKHDSYFGVPQILKFYNQLDGRPNRYGLLSVRGLNWAVVLTNLYKLRIKRISGMRDNDEDLRLKPIHAEWKLIRANQPTKIPFELWSVLVDTLCGESIAGQELPAIAYTDYDARGNVIPAAWGFELPRVLCPPGVARETFKSTILAPTTTKYDPTLQRMVVNPLNYSGFDINLLDEYLDNPTSIREFMGTIWKLADAKQINELFFAVLEDSLAYTRELPGLFKTSFIAVDDVRTSNLAEDNIL